MQEPLLEQLVGGTFEAQADESLCVIAPGEFRPFNPLHGQDALGRHLIHHSRGRDPFEHGGCIVPIAKRPGKGGGRELGMRRGHTRVPLKEKESETKLPDHAPPRVKNRPESSHNQFSPYEELNLTPPTSYLMANKQTTQRMHTNNIK